MNNVILHQMAAELPTLDRTKDKARITAIEQAICAYEFGMLKQSADGKAYFPLLKKHNGAIAFDDFSDILTDTLLGLLRSYNPEKGTFTTALSFLLDMRVRTYFERRTKKTKRETSLDALTDTAPAANEPFYIQQEYTEAEEPLKTEIRVFVKLAPYIANSKKMDTHRTKKMRFERFFTFDITKTIKTDECCAAEAKTANTAVFPVMEIILLKYLMHGEFNHISDVCVNSLKDKSMLNKRNEVIRKCYDESKPTVSKRNAAYFEIIKKAAYE